MKLLAIDTSGPVCGVAVLEDGRILYEGAAVNKLTHSVSLMPMVEEALNKCSTDISEIELYAAVVGPGSFTGVRIGVSAVKGMAHGAGKPCVAVDALEALAWGVSLMPDLICPIQDARAGQVYGAAFQPGRVPQRVMEDTAATAGGLSGSGACSGQAGAEALLSGRRCGALPHGDRSAFGTAGGVCPCADELPEARRRSGAGVAESGERRGLPDPSASLSAGTPSGTGPGRQTGGGGKSMSVTYRRMTLADAEAVHAIEVETFPEPWSLQSFQEEMTRNACARYIVAEEDGAVLGYAGAWLILDEGHITNVAVTKSRRGEGIGEALMRALMQYAANLGVQYMTLEVRKTNLIAQALYRKLHFIQLGVRKRYYEDNGEDALLYVCQEMPEAKENFTEEE